MPHNFTLNLGDERNRQGAIGSQGFYNQVLYLVTVRMVGKCGNIDLLNSFVIGACFRSNDQVVSSAKPQYAVGSIRYDRTRLQ